MKLSKSAYAVQVFAQSLSFDAKDKYGRAIGASVYVEAVDYVEVPEDSKSWSVSLGGNFKAGVVTGPGMYYQAFLQPLRDGADYQAYTRKTFATEAEALAYVKAYMAKKTKDAAKLAAKAK
jgi:hypothetical protein